MLRTIVPIVNFESETEEVDFGEGYALEPLDEEERQKLFGTDWISGNYTRHRLETIRYKLVCERDPHASLVPFQTRMFEIIRAMRLCRAGDLGAPALVQYTPGYKRWLVVGLLPTQRLGAIYLLRADDLNAIKQLLATFSIDTVRANRRLSIALGRFDDVYGRNRYEERIVDCFIALESCLTPDAKTEIGYKLAIRAAAILSQTRSPAEIRSLVAAGYDSRSKIVHQGLSMEEIFRDSEFARKLRKLKGVMGLDPSLNSVSPMSFTDHLVGLLRELLRAVISATATGLTVDKLVESLDERIASALSKISP